MYFGNVKGVVTNASILSDIQIKHDFYGENQQCFFMVKISNAHYMMSANPEEITNDLLVEVLYMSYYHHLSKS